MSLSNIQAKLKYLRDNYERDKCVQDEYGQYYCTTDEFAEDEEILSERNGITVTLRFESRLPFKKLLSRRKAADYPLLFLQWQQNRINANDDNYTFDRQQLEAGISFHF